jgi:hypothetical protein
MLRIFGCYVDSRYLRDGKAPGGNRQTGSKPVSFPVLKKMGGLRRGVLGVGEQAVVKNKLLKQMNIECLILNNKD